MEEKVEINSHALVDEPVGILSIEARSCRGNSAG